MPKGRIACAHHFHHVVTSSDGSPTCRGCGLRPTEEEKAAGIEALVRWEEARLRGTTNPNRKPR